MIETLKVMLNTGVVFNIFLLFLLDSNLNILEARVENAKLLIKHKHKLEFTYSFLHRTDA